MGIGGSNADLPSLKKYIEHHKAVVGREPDRWASPVTYASLQVLQQAIEKVGSTGDGHQRDQHRHVRHHHRQDPAQGQPLQGRLGGRPMAGRNFYGIAPKQDGARARSCRSRRGSKARGKPLTA
jgi:hypothetical protein